jgi:hypothetical protein
VSLIDEPKAWDSKASGQYLKTTSDALVLGVDYDVIDITYPSTTTEVFTYTLATVEVQVIRLTYSSASKNILIKVEVL